MSEQQFQSKIIKQYEGNGWYVIKLAKTNKNGIPDLLCLKENDCLFIEVKDTNGKVSKLQEFRMKELKEKGIKCLILTKQ